MRELHLGQDPSEPLRLMPGRCARPSRSTTGSTTRRTTRASSATAMARITPISLGASGPDRAKVKNTAIMTAAAESTTRPDVRIEPTMACSGSGCVS